MKRIALAALALIAVWLLSAIVVGLYYAAEGGHGGRPSVILVSVGFAAIVLSGDAALIRKLWVGKQRQT